MGAEKITLSSELESTKMNWNEKLNERLKMVSKADIVLFTSDWKEQIDSQLEFKEAYKLGKEIRIYRPSDMALMQKILSPMAQVHG